MTWAKFFKYLKNTYILASKFFPWLIKGFISYIFEFFQFVYKNARPTFFRVKQFINDTIKKFFMFFFFIPTLDDFVLFDFHSFFNLMFFLSCLFCFLFFVLFQTLFLREILLFFVSLDLAFTLVSVIFILLGFLFRHPDGMVFFFIILAVVACETALGLGFLVSFSRRHGSVTLSSLRYLSH